MNDLIKTYGIEIQGTSIAISDPAYITIDNAKIEISNHTIQIKNDILCASMWRGRKLLSICIY